MQTSKESILIAHIADTHLRDAQYATTKRGDDHFKAFSDAVLGLCAMTPRPDVIVCCGDVFHSSRPSARNIRQLIDIDWRLKSMDMRMLTITGNHDWSPGITWLETLFHMNDAAGVIPMDGKTVDVCGFKIAGIPPLTAAEFVNDTQKPDGTVNTLMRDADVVLYHNLITGIVPMFADSDSSLSVSQIPVTNKTKAVLLGDIHVSHYVNVPRPNAASCLVGYSGSVEMGSASEPMKKTATLLRVSSDHAALEGYFDIPTRAVISQEVRNAEDMEKLLKECNRLRDADPLVFVQFDRDMTDVVARVHSVLDPRKAIIRCYPLPKDEVTLSSAATRPEEGERLDVLAFVRKRLDSHPDLCVLAVRMITQGKQAAAGLLSQYIDDRQAAIGV